MSKSIKILVYNSSTDNYSEENISIPENNNLTKIAYFNDIELISPVVPGTIQAKVNECISAINSIKDALINFGLMNEQS